jgi:hypothetical protein
MNGFIDHLHTQLVTTSNYSAIANLYNLQFTTAPSKPFPACCIFTSHSLVTAFNSGDSSAYALKSCLNCGSLQTDSLPHRLPYRTDSVAPIVLLIGPRHAQLYKTPFPPVPPLLRVDCCRRNLFLCDCCLETNVDSEPLRSNGHSSGFTVLALSKGYRTNYEASC